MKLSNSMISFAAMVLLSSTTNAFTIAPPVTPSMKHNRISGVSSLFPYASTTALQMSSTEATKTTGSIDLMEEADLIFDSIDINRDGSITTQELRSHLTDQMGYAIDSPQCRYLFDAIDHDNSGEISRDEMRAAFATGAIQLFTTFGLGGSTLQEGSDLYNERIQQITSERGSNELLLDDLADMVFDLLDANESGTIDRDELRNHFEMVVSNDVPKESQTQEYVDTIMMVLDKNSDGVISRKELRQAFQQYDFRFLYETLGLPVYKRREHFE